MAVIIQWMDLIWLPLAFYVVHHHQRKWVLGFIIACMIMMRMQIELMVGIGYEGGIMGIMGLSVTQRSLLIYSFFYAVFLLLARYSKEKRGIIVFAAAISMFFMAFFVSSLALIL